MSSRTPSAPSSAISRSYAVALPLAFVGGYLLGRHLRRRANMTPFASATLRRAQFAADTAKEARVRHANQNTQE